MELRSFKCSWCFEKHPMTVIEKHVISRNTLECSNCCHAGAVCLTCDVALARGYADGVDKMCYFCKGYSSPVSAGEGRHCSWCFSDYPQLLYRSFTASRSEFICTKCTRFTLKCRTCQEGMSRKQASWCEELCAVCDGTVSDWQQPKPEDKNLSDRYCSWCASKCEQTLCQLRPTRRSVYTCSTCQMRTLPCKKCDIAMCKGGSVVDDMLCVACANSNQSWELISEKAEVIMHQHENAERLLEELSRDSTQRDLAKKQGVLEPFLLLVSMSPVARNQIASYLGFSLLTFDRLGDPHAEAWECLNRNQVGIQARTHGSLEKLNFLGHNSTYYDILQRVVHAVYPGADEADLGSLPWKRSVVVSSEANSEPVVRLQMNLLKATIATSDKHQRMLRAQAALWATGQDTAEAEPQADLDALDTVKGALSEEEIKSNLRAMRGLNSPELSKYALSVTKTALSAPGPFTLGLMAANWLTGFSAFSFAAGAVGGVSTAAALVASPLFVIGIGMLAYGGIKMVLGSSEGRVFEPLLMMINQRIVLIGTKQIDIMDYLK